MVRGEAGVAGVSGQVGEYDRLGPSDEGPEEAAAPVGQVPDQRVLLLGDAVRDELRQPLARGVDDADRRVFGVGELRRGLRDPVERGAQFEPVADRPHGLQQPRHAGGQLRGQSLEAAVRLGGDVQRVRGVLRDLRAR